MFPKVEIKQKVPRYDSGFVVGMRKRRTLHYSDSDLLVFIAYLPLNQHRTAAVAFLSRQLMLKCITGDTVSLAFPKPLLNC